jgi:hypothetical protein
LVIGALVGGGVGGIIQLGIQGRAADIPRLLRLLLRVALSVIFSFVLLFLGARLGQRFYGRVGEWVGLLGCAFLLFFVRSRLDRRSSSETPAALPPT